MYSKTTKNKKLSKNLLEVSNRQNECEVSIASTEIMLDRFCKGDKIDFPFQNN